MDSVLVVVKDLSKKLNFILNDFQEKYNAKFITLESELKGFHDFLVVEKECLSNLRIEL